MIIAIDGPAASGKGTLGKRLAAHYGLRHLDTGLLYRAVAHKVSTAGHSLEDRARASGGREIARSGGLSTSRRSRATRMGEAASIVSAIDDVRAALVDFQRTFAATPPGAVLDGRDIGTVICPRRRRENLRHRLARGPGAPALAGTHR